MESQIIKQGVLDQIKKDPILYGKVASELSVAPASLPRLIYANDKRLTQVGVLKIIGDHLHVTNSGDLLETITLSEDKYATII